MRWVAVPLSLLFLLTFAFGNASAAELDSEDLANLAEAIDDGQEKVTLLIAAKDDRYSQAAAALRSLGAVVTGGDPRIDYVKVRIPVDKVEQAAKLKMIEALDVDGLIPLDDPRPEGTVDPIPQTPPSASTPRDNPYLPIGETGAAQFVEDEPTRDGRDVVIAILDSGIDLDHPALKETSEGELKVIDWFNANGPNSGDGTWVTLSGQYNGAFTVNFVEWEAPFTGGPYAFGRLFENTGDLAGGELGGDLDRDGTKNEYFGVLQDRSTKEVYVDLDQDQDFTDETPMLDYKVAHQVGRFGLDDPETPVVEEVPFVVGTHLSNNDPASNASTLVNIGIAGSLHGTHVAGITAAGPMFGGTEMTGAAPGAKLMAVKVCLTTSGCTSSGLLDGMTYAAQNGADIVNLSVGGLPALNDGNNARALLYNSIIEEYGMQIVIAAGNYGPGANLVGDPSVATDSISVGASVSKETWLSNYGLEVDVEMGMHPFSSSGPREDGLMKPQVVAPGAAISASPLWQPGGPVDGTYALPPGYTMAQGTSMAAPQVTGAAALLIGAYKQQFGTRPDPKLLRNAIVSSARFLDGIAAYTQGAGLIDVAAAWEQMKLAAPTEPYNVTASVDVHTVLSGHLETPGKGRGIHDREGVTTGEDYTRTYTFTRTTGPEGPQRFDVSWLGDTGSFESADHVDLPLNQPTNFTVTVKPHTPGIHSAVLRLDDPDTDGIDFSTMNTVFAPETLVNGTVTVEGSLKRAEHHSVLVRVPEGADLLAVEFEGGGEDPEEGALRFRRISPEGISLESNSYWSCYNPPSGGDCSSGDPRRRLLENPMPGVWEIVVEARRDSSADDAPFKLTVEIVDIEIDPNPDDVSAQTYTSVPRTYTLTNHGASFTGHLKGSDLWSSRTQSTEIGQGVLKAFNVTVPADVSSLVVKTGNASDPKADIDLTLYLCTPACEQVGNSGNWDSEEEITVTNPEPGSYTINVYGYSVPNGTVTIDVLDRYASSSFGWLEPASEEAVYRAPGDSWAEQVTVTSPSDPGEGRSLWGEFWVEDEEGTKLARSEVTFRIDTEAPTTTITVPPPAASTNRTPTIEFTVSEPDATAYCAIDDGAFEECESPYTTPELEEGRFHTVSVKAVDGAGNESDVVTTDEFAVTAQTELVAEDVLIVEGEGGGSATAQPSARLSNARTDAPLAGHTVEFAVGSDAICSAVTNVEGVASCEGALPAGTVAGTPYMAEFAGGPLFESASATGLLNFPAQPSDGGPGGGDGPGGKGPGGKGPATCQRLKLGLKSRPFHWPGAKARPGVERIPGVRVRLVAGRDVTARIHPRVRYRVAGKSRVVRLKSRTIRIRGTRQIRFRLPARVQRQFRRAGQPIYGAKATLLIRASLAPTNRWPSCRQGPIKTKLTTQINRITPHASLSHTRR